MTNSKEKESLKDKVKEAFELIDQGLKQITTSEQYKKFLAFSSRFYNYSLKNQLLIWTQYPNASYVAGFVEWKKMGRYVKKGEKGIKILAPIHIRTTQNDNGEEKVIEYNRYRTISVFDISQTVGEPVPSLKGFIKTVPGDTAIYEMMKKVSPFPVEELDDCGGADGYYNLMTKDIKIWSQKPTAHRLLTLIHEIAHGVLHSDRKVSPGHKVMEIEAEAVGFVVCHALGIDASMNSMGYLLYFGGDSTMSLIEDSRERINLAAKTILNSLEKAYLPELTEA
ncbi:DUF1738 domain-containing protein (plasmid) [Cytobacillus oceanisediminis]|uniref:ArdC family protein n=1 Tax=Cytobacillus oceanisediminis TaxID=665099 RepID=UPI0018650706|nr:ArdC family protein [Cytobacillus oceanisediminis]QOK30083.1 DUF1738 domain-containing protein [Cytobacillus oceanisediminis]